METHQYHSESSIEQYHWWFQGRRKLLSAVLGDLKIKNLRLVAKGKWGDSGDVIVDKVPEPASVIGICDGVGGIKKSLSKVDNANLKKALNYIINN